MKTLGTVLLVFLLPFFTVFINEGLIHLIERYIRGRTYCGCFYCGVRS